jgi:hypothetical protein
MGLEHRVWLCWSFSQGAFHIEPESSGLEANIRAFERNSPVDYVPLAIFPSRESAKAAAASLRALADERHSRNSDPEESRWS